MMKLKVDAQGRVLITVTITVFTPTSGGSPKNESTQVSFSAYSKEEAIGLLEKYIEVEPLPF